MPGTNPAEAMRIVAGELPDFPYLPELPDRGPGADLTGRTAALLIDLAAEVTPRGWRLTDHPGRDLARARSMLSSELDVLEEVLDGFHGPLKIQLGGPWTLAATLELPHTMNVALADPGAIADLIASLAEGAAAYAADVAKRVPGGEADRPVRRARPARGGRGCGADRERDVTARRRRARPAAGRARPGARGHPELHGGALLCPAVPFGTIRGAGAGRRRLRPQPAAARRRARSGRGGGGGVGVLTASWCASCIGGVGRGRAGLSNPGRTERCGCETADGSRGWRALDARETLLEQAVVTPACGLAARPRRRPARR